MHPGLHGTTFGGGPLACAVAIEFLREEQKLLKHVVATGEYFGAALEQLDGRHGSIQDVRGTGLMRAIELDSPIGEGRAEAHAAKRESSSIARMKRCCDSCRPTLFRRSMSIS